jgi:hypothetical protein
MEREEITRVKSSDSAYEVCSTLLFLCKQIDSWKRGVGANCYVTKYICPGKDLIFTEKCAAVCIPKFEDKMVS